LIPPRPAPSTSFKMIVMEYRPNLAILNVYLGFEQLHVIKQQNSDDFDDRLVIHKVEAPAEEECESESVAVLTLRGKSRIDGNSEEEDAAAIDIFSFYWPSELEPYHPVMGQMQNCGSADTDELYLRLRLSSHPDATWKDYEVVKKPAPYDMSSKKAWSADETFLRCVYLTEGERDGGVDNKDVEIRLVCNLCSSEMGDLVKKGRFLPLPTVDWQELAPEWFCGCKHNGKSSGGGAGDVKETKNHKNKESKGKKAEKESNKANNSGGNAKNTANDNLHSSHLDPCRGDVLWAPGLIRVSRSMLDPKRASVLSPASKASSKQCVRCETCKVSIGHAVSAQSVQLWSYGIRVVSKRHGEEQKKEEAADSSALTGEQRHIKCKDTFLDILNGAISESLEPIPRFYFVSPTRVLFVWVMDRELQMFTTDDEASRFGCRMRGRVVRKCLVKMSDRGNTSDDSSNKWRRDETATVISVNEDLFSCAVDIWENWQKCLPPNFRKDKVWDVALFPKDSGLR